jgi:hypothetical protein
VPELTHQGRRPAGRPSGLLVLLAWSFLSASAPLHAATFDEEINVARDFFLIADYASALDKVTALLRAGAPTAAERIAALELEARCHLALGERTRAIDSFCSALREHPEWRPDLGAFTVAERDAFAKAFELCGPLDAPLPRVESVTVTDPQEIAPADQPPAPPGTLAEARESGRPWYRSPWVIGGVGGVLAGVAFLTFGDEDSPAPAPLPDFPPPPVE